MRHAATLWSEATYKVGSACRSGPRPVAPPREGGPWPGVPHGQLTVRLACAARGAAQTCSDGVDRRLADLVLLDDTKAKKTGKAGKARGEKSRCEAHRDVKLILRSTNGTPLAADATRRTAECVCDNASVTAAAEDAVVPLAHSGRVAPTEPAKQPHCEVTSQKDTTQTPNPVHHLIRTLKCPQARSVTALRTSSASNLRASRRQKDHRAAPDDSTASGRKWSHRGITHGHSVRGSSASDCSSCSTAQLRMFATRVHGCRSEPRCDGERKKARRTRGPCE